MIPRGARPLLLATILLAGAALASCFRHVTTPYAPQRELMPVPAASGGIAFFDEDRGAVDGVARSVTRSGSSRYSRIDVSFPSVGDNGQKGNLVTARYYESRLPGRKALVIVLPIWGSYSYPSRTMTWHLLHRTDGEANVLWVQGDRDLFDWPELLGAPDESAFLARWRTIADRDRVNVVDTRRLIDWAERRPEIDRDRIGLLGFSHSAMVGALIAESDRRISAAALVMAGGRPHEVIATCPGDGTGDAATFVERKFGWSRAEYATRLEPIYRRLDPSNYPGRIDPARVLFIDAGRDDCMPADARESLWRTLGRPERVTFGYTHKVSFLAMTPLGLDWMRYRVSDFFLRTLLPRPAGRRPATVVAGAGGIGTGPR